MHASFHADRWRHIGIAVLLGAMFFVLVLTSLSAASSVGAVAAVGLCPRNPASSP